MTLARRSLLRAAGTGALTLLPLGSGSVLRAATPDPVPPWTDAPAAACPPRPSGARPGLGGAGAQPA
jgi:hypothetical protein